MGIGQKQQWGPGGTPLTGAGRGTLKATVRAKAPFWKQRGPQSCSVRNWQAVLWEQQPRSHLDTDTRARESGRRKGLRRRRPTRAGTRAWHQHQKRRDSTGDEKNTPASGRPPTHSSVSRSVLIGWLTWFGNEVPFYNSARDSSQSLAIQYNALITFSKTKKAGELSGAHLVSA